MHLASEIENFQRNLSEKEATKIDGDNSARKRIWKRSASGGIAGGNAVTRDFCSWGSAPRAKREQSSPEERERISGGVAQECTTGKDSSGEIDMTLVVGCALRRVHSQGSGL